MSGSFVKASGSFARVWKLSRRFSKLFSGSLEKGRLGERSPGNRKAVATRTNRKKNEQSYDWGPWDGWD